MKKLLLNLLFVAAVLGSRAQSSIYSADFQGNGTSLPTGWTQSTLGTYGWKVGNNTALQSTYFPIAAHTTFACSNDDACNCNKSADTLKTLSMDFSGHAYVELAVDVYFLKVAPETGKILASTNGGTSWTVLQNLTGNNSWHTVYVGLNAYAGNSNVMLAFVYNDGAAWSYGFAIDNVNIFEPAGNDASFTSLTPATGSGTAYQTVGNTVTIGGTIMNLGANTISSITIKYSDGTTTYTDNKTGLNITAFSSYTFTHNTPFAIPSLGSHPLNAWVELTGDANHTNDTLANSVRGVPFLPQHKVVFEEATGTWCGWCPRGAVFMDSMQNVHPSDAILIAVHNADPMVVTAYDAGVGSLVSGYPSVLCNRAIVDDPSNMFPLYNEHIGDFGFADLTVTPSFNTANNVITTTVDAHAADDLNGNYRLAVVVTEDSLFGATTTWAQHNYYSFQSQNIALQGAGHNWQTSTNPVPAASMHYDHVSRSISGTFTGTAGSLPAAMMANNTYSYTFTYTKPATQRIDKMHVYALLFDVTANRILNANTGSIVTGISKTELSDYTLLVYPNPAQNNLTVDLKLNSTKDVKVSLTDITGRELTSFSQLNVSVLNHQFDVSQYAKGIYFVKISANGEMVTKKVTVE
jgi:hypothetical protein